MKRFAKIVLVLACLIFIVGIGLFIGGVVMGASFKDMTGISGIRNSVRIIRNLVKGEDDWDIVMGDEWDEEWEDLEQTLSPNITSGDSRVYQVALPKEIKIKLRADELYLREHDGDGVRIVVENDQKENVRIKSDGDKLSIKSINHQNDRTITLYYPDDSTYKKLDIQIDAGTVYVEDAITVDELNVNVGAGEFLGEKKITAQEAEFEVGAGNIEAEMLDVQSLDGQCGLGNMDLSLVGRETDYDYKLECGLGNISLNGEDYGGIAREKKIHNSNAERTINLECGMGNITVSFKKN